VKGLIFQASTNPFEDLLAVFSHWDLLFTGFIMTMWLYAWALLMGFFLGLMLAIIRQYGGRIFSPIATGYIEIVRGTPMLIQLWLIYSLLLAPLGRWTFYSSFMLFGRELTIVFLNPRIIISIITLGLNSAAYQAEYLRGAIVSVGPEQLVAAQSLGMSRAAAIRHIILPQALRRVIPSWSNEAAYLPKYTVIVSIIGVTDIFQQAKNIGFQTLLYLPTYIIVAIIFLITISLISKGLSIVHKRTGIPGL
jgi:polar amino acid transport system permease protein